MSQRRLQVSFDLPAEAAGLVQAAAIHLGGTILSIELVELVETYSKNLPRLTGPKKKEQRRHFILTIIDKQLQRHSEVSTTTVKRLAAKKKVKPGTVQFYFKRELQAGRLIRSSPGIYRRP